MSATVLREARGHVAALIGPQPPGAKLKNAFPRVARFVGLSERRIRAIWNHEARAIRADEIDALREAVERKEQATYVTDHASRLEAAARALEAIDPDFHRPENDRLRNVARRIRDAASHRERK